MKGAELAEALVDTLPVGELGLFNPWREICAEDLEDNGPEAKMARLAEHLACDAQYLLCGEAAGYQGLRHSGVAFTSERLLIEGAIPRISANQQRLTRRRLPYSEPSATIVWKTLYALGIAESTVLWNALQLHPHRPGFPQSNRTPTDREVRMGAKALDLLTQAMPKAKVIAVGRKAEQQLLGMGVATVGAVRHPANGGATLFASGLRALVEGVAG